MCLTHKQENKKLSKLTLYIVPIALGIISGIFEIEQLLLVASCISDITVKLFKIISLPLISLSLVVTIANYAVGFSMSGLSRKILCYTFFTTIVAAIITLGLYLIIEPNVQLATQAGFDHSSFQVSYAEHIGKIIPSNIIEPFITHNVFGVMIISILFGVAIRNIDDEKQRDVITSYFKALHSIFIVLTGYLIRFIPVAMFGFVAMLIKDLQQGTDYHSLADYLLVILLANFLQGVLFLPLLLKSHSISTVKMLKGALPALSLAFFSKSSAATLPVTIDCAVNKLDIDKNTANFVLPLCTTINMNGCAAFILATVLFVMQHHGVVLTPWLMLSWVVIATIAAVGNAGVPMGCFFLSASLLSSMGMDIKLLGVILPFYGIIDMVETSLNVWSDLCVTKIVTADHSKNESKFIQIAR